MLHKVSSICLALLVLCSTVSFTVEKHFCHDTLVDVAVFTQVEDCCENPNESTYTPKSCCKEEVSLLEGQNELIVKKFEDYDVDHQVFITSFIYSYSKLFEELSQKIIPHKNYSPPNLIVDRQSMHQVFII